MKLPKRMDMDRACPYHSNGCLGLNATKDRQCMDCRCDKEEQGAEIIKATSDDQSVVMIFAVVVIPNVPSSNVIDMSTENENE